MSSEISEEQYQKIFNLFDRRKCGFVRAEDLHLVFKSIGKEMTMKDVKQMLKDADCDNNEVIDFNEFKQLLDKSIGSTSIEEELMEGFRFFDKNQDGTLTAVEISEIMSGLS